MNNAIKPNLLKPRWSKVFTDLWEDKTRTGLVVASIAVGVFAIGMIINAYVILKEDINHAYQSINPPNIEVRTDLFNKDLVHVIEKIPGVKEAEGRRVIEIRARKGDGSWQNLKLIGVTDSNSDINLLTAREGTIYPDKNETLIGENMMIQTGFHPGDIVEIELPDGTTHELTVAGLVVDQTMAKPEPNPENVAYVTMKTLRSL